MYLLKFVKHVDYGRVHGDSLGVMWETPCKDPDDAYRIVEEHYAEMTRKLIASIDKYEVMGMVNGENEYVVWADVYDEDGEPVTLRSMKASKTLTTYPADMCYGDGYIHVDCDSNWNLIFKEEGK